MMAVFRKKAASAGSPPAPDQAPPLSPPDDAPDGLRRVWPLVLHWGVGDDDERRAVLDGASVIELQALVDAVDPLLKTIDGYLDATADAERATPFGSLAQAAIEARIELSRRA